MNIIKIGGTVLRDKSGFSRMIKIIGDYGKAPLLIVISAFSKATRQLENAAMLAEQGLEKKSFALLAEVLDWHANFANEILKDKIHIKNLLDIYNISGNKISGLLKGLIITRELTPRTLDEILSFGELFALQTVNQFLIENGLDIESIDSTNLIVSDSVYGSAKPFVKETQKKINEILLPAFERKKIILTQGFVARNLQGEITTMGIESSNLTATILAELLNVDEVHFWSDVEGIRTADPKISENTASISQIDYSFAYKLAVNGLKLIYPSMIEHAKHKNIKLKFHSAINPEGDFTEISNKKTELSKQVIIQKSGLTLINIRYDTNEQMHEIRNSICNDSVISQLIFSLYTNPDCIQVVLPQRDIQHLRIVHKFKPEIFDGVSVISVFNIKDEIILSYLNVILDLIKNKKPFNFETGKEKNTARFLVPDDVSDELIKLLSSKFHEIINKYFQS